MKKLLGIVVLGLLFSSQVHASNLKPLDKYLEDQKEYMGDPSVASYLFTRCSAFYFFVAAITYEQNLELSNRLRESSKYLSLLNTQLLIKKFNKSTEDAFKTTDKIFKKMTMLYNEDGEEFYAKTGSYFLGTPLENDKSICDKVLSKTAFKY